MRSEPLSLVQRVLLDTSVLIDLGRNRRTVVDWIQDALARKTDVCVSTVAIAEFFAGIAAADRRRWIDFVETLSVWEVTLDIALQAGAYRHDLARQGRTLQIPDALIAATAVAAGAVLVTANVKDFPIPDIQIIVLRA